MMFNLFKKEKKCLVAPVSGNIIKLSEVKDEVFSSGMMGIGLAIDPTGDVFVAPADGEITVIPETKHAFGMKLSNGMEVLIHIGMDTVNLAGEGFDVLVKEGQKVNIGTPIIKVDLDFFKDKNISLVTPIIILNHNDYSIEVLIEQGMCVMNETKIIKC